MVKLMLQVDNFDFHCHCQFTWIFFCVLLIYIVSYHVLLTSAVCQQCILLVYSSIWTTFISNVIVNSAGSIFLGPTYLYCVLLSPRQVPSVSKTCFVGLLIYMDNFYFHCYCQFSWIFFLGPTNLYCVLPSPTQVPNMSKMLKQKILHYLIWFSMINDIFSMVKVDVSWYSLNYTFNFLLLIKASEQKVSIIEKVDKNFFLLIF